MWIVNDNPDFIKVVSKHQFVCSWDVFGNEEVIYRLVKKPKWLVRVMTRIIFGSKWKYF